MAEENESEQSGTPGRTAVKLGVKKLTAIIVAVIIVALAGIGGGYAYWTHHEGNAYHEAVAQAENADKALSKAIEQATATEYKADQLKEPKLLDKLDAAISKAKALKGVPNDAPSEWLAWQLASARKANATDADEADAQAKALNAVRDSKLAKELDGAKDQLKRGIDSAGKTLKDTDGKVADNATRDSLKKAIDEASSALSKKGVTDPKTYTDAKAKLDAAVKRVTDSKAAKEKADTEAAAQAQAQAAAQAAAAAAAAQPQSSYAQSYNRYGGSGSGYSSSRGYSAPQQSYTPSNNGGGSSGGSSLADLIGAASSGNSNELSTGNYAPIEH